MMKVKTKHEANGPVSNYIKHHYRHFNSAVVIDAADAYVNHLNSGGKMFVTLGGAMSTAELGLSSSRIKCTPFAAPARIWKRTSTILWRTTTTSEFRTIAI